MTQSAATYLGVIGRPVLHSRSPEMHSAALRALGIPGSYLRIAVDSARQAISMARDIGFSGLNVTSPFKEEAFLCAASHDDLSPRLSAANTLVLNEKERAFNTDVYGVSQALLSAGVKLSGSRAVVIGAGGAARAAVCALRFEGAHVTVINRTAEKARALAGQFGTEWISLSDPSLAATVSGSNVIVSCVSTPERILPAGLVTPGQTVMDGIYKTATALVEDAKQSGATLVSGLEWLLHQGAKAFELFTDRKPPLDLMRNALTGPSTLSRKRGVALIGMMGSGKSNIGKALENKLGFSFIDLDKVLETRCGKTIRALVDEEGESRFRDLEEEVLRDCSIKANIIAGCGGGVVIRPGNREILSESFLTIWLWSPVHELANRVAGDEERPLLNGFNVHDRLSMLLDERREWYAAAADLVVPSWGADPEDIAERIAYEIRAAGIA